MQEGCNPLKNRWEVLKKQIFFVVIFLIIAGLSAFLYVKLEGNPPAVTFQGFDEAIRADHELRLKISDPKSGIRSVSITLEKDGKTVVLFDEAYPAINFIAGGEILEKDLTATIKPQEQGFSDGEATFRLIARDYAWRNWWHGNKTLIEKPVLIDFHPPRIEVLSPQHNINQGGACLVVYKLSEPCPENGVRVGENFFHGYPVEGDKDNRIACLFALDYRQGKETEISLVATDRAGNSAKAGFYHHIRGKKFRSDQIPLSDGFLSQKMPEFDDSLFTAKPASPLEKFLAINRETRIADHDKFKSISKTSDGTMHWESTFLRLPNAASRAAFADHRDYQYQGKSVDNQVHLGVDLASLAHSPVPAANTGKVVFTGPIGIYGETVVIDHGLGLFSTYSHLSGIQAEQGQMVNRGDIIGSTGMTGLAAGDHLHYGMLVAGVFVNPVEWWDPEWIKNNVTSKIGAAR